MKCVPVPTLTIQEAREMYKGARNLQIETDACGFVTRVSYEAACLNCGKYHRKKKHGLQYASKAGRCCERAIIGMAFAMVHGEEMSS